MNFIIRSNKRKISHNILLRLDDDYFKKINNICIKNRVTKQSLIYQMIEYCIKEMENI